jgi:hypothetical protein
MSDTYINEPNLLEELEKPQEQLDLEETVKQLQETLEGVSKEKTALEYKLEQSELRESLLAKQLRRERNTHQTACRNYERALGEAAAKQRRSIVCPSVLFALFAALSLLVGLCVEKGWMVVLLGEMLTCACLCICSYCGGLIWGRTRG